MFRGALGTAPPPATAEFDPQAHLDGIKADDFQLLFHTWIAQCWLYDYAETIPMTREELSDFDLDHLIPLFEEKYVGGDWKLVNVSAGATMDEMVLCWQMLARQPIVLLLNEEKTPPKILPERIRYHFIGGKVLLSIFLEFINHLVEADIDSKYIALVTDGVAYHVFNPMVYDESRRVLRYEDNIGEHNRHFLNTENNALGIDADFIGYHKRTGKRAWEVSLEDFEKVFYGVPLFDCFHDLWNSIAYRQAMEHFGSGT